MTAATSSSRRAGSPPLAMKFTMNSIAELERRALRHPQAGKVFGVHGFVFYKSTHFE